MAASARAFSSLTRWPTSRLASSGRGLQPGVVDLRQHAVLARQPAVAKFLPVGFGMQRASFGIERREQFSDGAIQRIGRVVVEFGNGVHGRCSRLKPARSMASPLKGLGSCSIRSGLCAKCTARAATGTRVPVRATRSRPLERIRSFARSRADFDPVVRARALTTLRELFLTHNGRPLGRPSREIQIVSGDERLLGCGVAAAMRGGFAPARTAP